MFKKKISLIGAGNIGSTLAHLILLKNLGNVILFDITDGLPQGKALDLLQCASIEGCDFNIKGTNKYEDIENSDIVVVTAGISRKPGMSRDDMLETNGNVMKVVGSAIKKFSPNAFVICITNPLDTMVNILQNYSNISNNKIIGMSGNLDAARFKTFLSLKFNVSVKDVNVCILGSHGDSMIPLIKLSNIAGITLENLIKTNKISENELTEIIEKTKQTGGEIISLLKTNSAYYAPASAAIEIIEAYLLDKKKILSCSIKLTKGQYNICEEIFCCVPVKIGSNGIEEILELPLTEEEKKILDYSIERTIDLNKFWINRKIK